ncbi:hypothetical protein GOBAR_AA05022 [Gossypium barbadense]|uniref:Uncharacterized protein n=1 Tax=Gossypium barbadense TaxID=3634 RepID=A0A2P5YIZ3_GOSBA|nr:hypothetical protein GOBAR_AA05022 [Gossypium barbadense]
MIETSTNLDWYKGPTLLEALDQISEPKRPSDKPLRLQLQDVYKIGGFRRGYIASNSEDDPAKKAANFTYQDILMNYHGQIGNTYAPVLDYHASPVPVSISEMVPTEPMVVETFFEYPPTLGSFSRQGHASDCCCWCYQECLEEGPDQCQDGGIAIAGCH